MDKALVKAVASMVRRRVPASEVDDIVQSTLAEAVASTEAPDDPTALRRWLSGVVRHKVADFHRRRHRELALDQAPESASALEPIPHEDRDLLRWARRQLPSAEAEKTLEWMMHEADGEKLEAIAEREHIPATRIRQRVVRLRAFFRERWHRELVLASLIAVAIVIGLTLLRNREAPPIAEDPAPKPRLLLPPELRAQKIRDEAEAACERAAYRECLDKLDEARALDPAGESAPSVRKARAEAERALREPIDSRTPSPGPSSSASPPTPTAVPTGKLAPMPSSAPPPIRQPSKLSKPPSKPGTSLSSDVDLGVKGGGTSELRDKK